jgi:ABC-type Zn uptake system ZnuABC Zn-binding protein ZnuA
MPRHIRILTLLLILLSACSSPASDSGTDVPASAPSAAPATLAPTATEESSVTSVLASTTLLADIAQAVAGDRLKIESILPAGSDPHSYQYTPKDVAKVAGIELLILFDNENYEVFLEPLLYSAGGDMEFVFASAGVSKRVDFAMGGMDPHVWLDPNNVIICVENIREGLTHFDPDGTAEFQTNAVAYAGELTELDAWIVKEVDQIPAEKRLLVTNHEALGYFAERYGFTVVGTIVESFSSDASPSAQQMAGLIDQIKATGAPAIFLDASDNPTLAEQIAAETGVTVVTDLHLESLTDGPPAATYLDMMKHNVTQIVDALK